MFFYLWGESKSCAIDEALRGSIRGLDLPPSHPLRPPGPRNPDRVLSLYDVIAFLLLYSNSINAPRRVFYSMTVYVFTADNISDESSVICLEVSKMCCLLYLHLNILCTTIAYLVHKFNKYLYLNRF